MLGIEAEIAFRFDRAFPPRKQPFERDEVAAAVTAFPAIEIVGSRFCSYADTPPIVRVADYMSNAAFVAGRPRPDWRSFDLKTLEASLSIDGIEVVRRVGGNANDPLDQAVALVNALRAKGGIAAGKFVTTGTYTGLSKAIPARSMRAVFAGFGSAEMYLTE